MSLQIGGGGHTLAVNVEIAYVLQQLRFQGRRIYRVAALHFRELGSAQHAVFAILAAREHTADHVAIYWHDWESGGHVSHSYGHAVLRQYGPDGLFFQHIGIGCDPSDDEAADAVLFRLGAGEQRAVYAWAVRRRDRAQVAGGPFFN